MANRRNYGSGNYSGGGTGYNQPNRSNYNLGAGIGVNPWQSGNSPGRSGLQGTSSNVPSLLATNNILNQLTTDPQLALATKLLTSILPVQQSVQQPPSLMSLNNSFGNSMRYSGSGGNFGGDRFRRDDRRNDNFRNRRQTNDRNKDRKGGDNKARSDKSKTKSVKDEKDKAKKEVDDEENDDERREDEKEREKEREKSKGKSEKGEDESQKESTDKEEGPIPEYENIPTKLFHCHVCGKSMWNDVSFDTHVKGRNHRNKLRDLEENYQSQTDLMRQIAAVSLKLDEFRRGGKRRPYPDQYCKMCDLHFNGMTMFAHRSTTEHQNLKRFIHPTCELCKIDFQVRIEYDEHILTPQHLQQEAKALLRKEKFEKDPKYVELREREVKFTSILDEANDIGEKGDVVLSAEDRALMRTILDEKESLPEYDPDSETLIASHFVVPQSGFYCKACKLFLLEEAVVDTHCRTAKHYNNYISILKTEANKKQKDSEAVDPEKRKSGSNEDNGGNWKRRKVDNIKSELNGGNKYDPEETLNESLEDNTSEASADGPVKEESQQMEVSEPEIAEEDKTTKPVATPRRGRTRTAKK